MDLIQKVLLQEHYFMQKVCEAMKSSESHKMNDKRIVERSPVSQSQLVCN